MKPRKVLIAAMGLEIGGAETHVTSLARELVSRGSEVIVVSAGGVYERDIAACGAKHVNAPLNTRSPIAMLKALFILRRVIRSEKPEVVHAHARIPAFLCGLVWNMTPKTRRFRFVTTAHWVFDVTPLTKMLSNWGQKQLAVSEDIKKYLVDNYYLNESGITLTVNGIDTENFSPEISGIRFRRELGIPDNAPVVLSVSRLDLGGSGAGHTAQCLAEAAPKLITAVPGVRVVITGGGVLSGDSLEKSLRDIAELINKVAGYRALIITGQRTDINEVFAACNLFVGVSRSALEAMSCGKPVLLAGGEGYLGLLTPAVCEAAAATNFTCRNTGKTTPQRVAEDAVRFFTDVSENGKRALSDFSRKYILDNYSAARMVDDALKCYDDAFIRRKVVMSGYYGFDNAGDEAILQSVLRSAEDTGFCDVTVLSKKPRFTRKTHGCRSVNRFNPFALTFELKKASLLIFGGGSLLQDETSTRSLLYYITVLKLARLLGVKTMIYANGIGPVLRPANRARVAAAVTKADAVTLRDAQSLKELAEMGVPREKLTLTSDPVLLIKAPEADESHQIVQKLGIKTPYIVFSVRSQKSAPALPEELARLADMLRENLNMNVLFVPMQTPNDIAASKEITDKMKYPPNRDVSAYNAHEILAILRCAEAVLTMRLHTLIFAARTGSPTAAIDLNPKINAFLKELGMPNLGTPETFKVESALVILSDLAMNRDERSAELLYNADVLAQRARADGDILRTVIG